MRHCLIFSREIFYVTIVLCLNILWLKAVSEITARQTGTSFAKFIKACSIEYWTTRIELVLPTFKSRTVHKIIEYLTLGLLSSHWNIYHSTTAYFFDPPCILCRVRRKTTTTLRSASTLTLVIPSTRRTTLGDPAFPVTVARAWNALPSSVRSAPSLLQFRQRPQDGTVSIIALLHHSVQLCECDRL